MKEHIDNLTHKTFPKIHEYLSGTQNKTDRFINEDTLKKFRVGAGTEKFFDEESRQWKQCEVVYFPMYAPLSTKQKKQKFDEYLRRTNDMSLPEKRILMEELRTVEMTLEQVEELKDGGLTPEHFEIELIKTKVRAVGENNKSFQRTLPVGVQQQALFGLPTVKPDDTFLVITEGEYDAMAVHQETQFPCVSLP